MHSTPSKFRLPRRAGLWALLAAAAVAAGYLIGQVAPYSPAEASAPSAEAPPAARAASAGHGHQAPAGSGSDRYQYARPEVHHTAGQPPLPPEKVFPIEPPPRPARPGVREYRLVVREDSVHEVAPDVRITAWTFNGRVPGPVLRAVEGDLLRVTLVNEGNLPHTIHFHGIHPSDMDGVFELVPPGRKYTYEFEARPFGVFPYHCHSMPSSQHIHNGLYGMMIVDPVKPRPPMKELALIMSAFDTDRDGEADFYAWNGRAFQYATNPVPLETGEKVRMYVLNMFEEIMAPHIHASMFHLYPSGTSTTPSEYTDVVDLAIAERAIMEFDYEYPGTFMFQCHISEHMELGLMGWFKVSGEPKPRRVAAAGSGA
jgi:FtsP/CotA-like multicopper oxidase with cupredoxin domain